MRVPPFARTLINIHRMITRHPLTRGRVLSAYARFLRWQMISRFARAGIIVPFVDDTRLVVNTGQTGATANIYVGLAEFEDMSFTLHFLREGDLFGDIGANVGVYTVLAGGVRRARVLAMEPVPQTAAALRRNIAINQIEGRVAVEEVGVGERRGVLTFSTNLDAMNHVVADGEGVSVTVMPLDEIFVDQTPIMLKIDVEGFETNVLNGGGRVLASPELKVVIVELNGMGAQYGFDDAAIDARMRGAGFKSYLYDPWSRKLTNTDRHATGNTLYIRDYAFAAARLEAAAPFHVLGSRI